MLTAKLKLYSKNVITCKIYLDDAIISSTYGHMATYIPNRKMGKHTLVIDNNYNHTDYHVDVVEAEFEWTKEEIIGGLTIYSCNTREVH